MSLDKLRKNWEQFGRDDPYWAILTDPEKRGQKWDIEAFYRSGQREIGHLMHFLENQDIQVAKQAALDFGCGAGRLTQALADYFEEVVGVDIAESMIELGRKRNPRPDRVTYLHNSHPDLRKLDDASMDLIYSNITLQHIPPVHIRTYLVEFMRVLRPEGLLVFQLPAGIRKHDEAGKWSWQGWLARLVYRLRLDGLYRRIRYFRQPIMDMHWLPKSGVEQLLESKGGKILKTQPDQSAGPIFESYRYYCRKV
jgi:ubiquinone/menaquinone biosynthesis C-methylase UbiE